MLTATLVTAVLLAHAQAPPAQTPSHQALFEAGRTQEAIDQIRAREDAPRDQIFLRALAHRKLDQHGEAREAFAALAAAEEGSAWSAIGQSGAALVDGDLEAAATAARQAVELDGELPQAWYQLGLIGSVRGDHAESADAFARAAELNPQMAYAHYEAGMAFYQVKRVDRMAVFFENFLKLAPKAPEAPAVQSIMRTVRGRR
jgi:protein O-GlcNAc transferase